MTHLLGTNPEGASLFFAFTAHIVSLLEASGQKHTHVHVTLGQLSLLTHCAQAKKKSRSMRFFASLLKLINKCRGMV